MIDEDVRQNDEQNHKLIGELKSTNKRNEKLKKFNDNFEKIDEQLNA